MSPIRAERPRDAHPWRRYLRFWKPDLRADINEEVQFHIDSAVEEFIASGKTRADAESLANEKFGNVGIITQTMHSLSRERELQMQRNEWWNSVAQDIRFALRQLARNRGFALVAVLTLSLGIGATSAIFSVVNSVLLRPLPYASADRLLRLRERNGPENIEGMAVTFGNYASWVEQSRSFEALGGYIGDRPRTLTGTGDPMSLRVVRASADYWRAMFIQPAAGRYFNQAEDREGAEPVVVLSYALWQARFAGDTRVVGTPILLNGVAHTVVGVASADYALTYDAAQSASVYLPLALTSEQRADHADHEMTVIGLLRRGVTPQVALAELTRIEGALALQYPQGYFDGAILAVPLRDVVVGNVRPVLLMLFGAVALVLLIACTNVANLLLARAAVREKEMAVRSALGGSRHRIMRQLLVESLVLAVGGAALGLLLAGAGLRALVQSAPTNIARLNDVALDTPMVAFTVVLAMASGIAFGLFPSIRASRADLRSALSQGGRGTGGARYGIRASLVIGQVAIALVLLVGAGLLLRSAIRLQNVAPGFQANNVLAAGISLPASRYGTDELSANVFHRIVMAVSAIPGVTSAATISRVPIGAFGMDCTARPEPGASASAKPFGANQRSVTPALFQTLGMPLVAGRAFTSTDRIGAPPVVIINRSFARQLFESEDVVGRRITSCTKDGAPEWRTIVGVIGDVRANGLTEVAPNEVYFPVDQRLLERSVTLVVRTVNAPTSLVPEIRRTLKEIDPLLPLANITTMQDIVSRSVAVPRFATVLLVLLGALGLILSVIGIYGVIAYFVAQRTREIGVRIALGAKRTQVVQQVVLQGVGLVSAGIAVGLGLAWFAAGIVENQLFEVSAHDPAIFLGVSALLLVVAIAASAVPALRAARVDPLVAMRS